APPDCRVWVFLALGLHRMLGRHPPLAVIPLPRSLASLGLRLSLAGSPRPQAESSSLTLRTSHSPPVAPHPASRRRSYLRLREAKPPLDGDLHPAYSQPSQAHECGGVRRFGFFLDFFLGSAATHSTLRTMHKRIQSGESRRTPNKKCANAGAESLLRISWNTSVQERNWD